MRRVAADAMLFDDRMDIGEGDRPAGKAGGARAIGSQGDEGEDEDRRRRNGGFRGPVQHAGVRRIEIVPHQPAAPGQPGRIDYVVGRPRGEDVSNPSLELIGRVTTAR